MIKLVPSHSRRGIFPASFKGFPEDSKTFENVRFKIGTDGVKVFSRKRNKCIKEVNSNTASAKLSEVVEETSEDSKREQLLNMWGDAIIDPWTSRFHSPRNPFAGFDGFYGERQHTSWGNPVYFPFEEPRRVSDRKKTGRVKNRPSAATVNIPVYCEARANPVAKPRELKIKEKANHPSRPKISQHEDDKPIKIQPPQGEDVSKDEDASVESCEENFYDACEEIEEDNEELGKPDKTELSGDKGSASQESHTNTDTETVKESFLIQSGTQTAEEEKLDAIKTVLTRAKELYRRVQMFEGSRQDKEFLYLEEHLTRCLLGLDLINADGLQNVKLTRKTAVKEILSVITNLETRVSKDK